MAISPEQSLLDLAARTATADSDLIHVNSGGADYKQTKADFLDGSFEHIFTYDTLLTTQADAFPLGSTHFGYVWNYGHTSETGMPINALSFVKVSRTNNAGYSYIEAWSATEADGKHYLINKNNGTWGSWVQVPSRAEITSLNSSLANSCKVVHKIDNCGALAANARGYVSLSVSIPSGYKTTGIYALTYNHPAAEGGAGLNLGASFPKNATGTITVYISYNTIDALSAANSDFELHIHCVPSTWDV